jgi:hypothetical protein
MKTYTPIDISLLHRDDVLKIISTEKESSPLGFFSKPFRVQLQGKENILKVYTTIQRVKNIVQQKHDTYKKELEKTGIKIPHTQAILMNDKKKPIFVIVQEPFEEEELVRGILQRCEKEKIIALIHLLFEDVIRFWKNKPNDQPLGFHPTLRNYAIREQELYYVDTFPPMNFTQEELNRFILHVAPAPGFITFFIPEKSINRVTDEYYSVEKMIIGLIGSTCRLRPEHADEILAYSKTYISQCSLNKKEKENLLRELTTPPRLSLLWRMVRKITGNVGMPNVK